MGGKDAQREVVVNVARVEGHREAQVPCGILHPTVACAVGAGMERYWQRISPLG